MATHNPGAAFAQRVKENQRKQERERAKMEAQFEALTKYGAKPPVTVNAPPSNHGAAQGSLTPIEIETIPIDPRIIQNRFGTVSLASERRHAAPETSPGGQHMGKGSQRVSILAAEPTPGGKHIKAGSKLYSFKGGQIRPAALANLQPAVPSYPHNHFQGSFLHNNHFQANEPAALSHPRESTDSSIQVIEMIPCPIKRQGLLIEVVGHGPLTMDKEGDTPMRNALSTIIASVADHSTPPSNEGTNSPVTLPNGVPALRNTPPPEERKGKGKQARVDTPTDAKCNRCRNRRTSTCRYSDKDCCNSCQGFHPGRYYREGRKPGTEDKGKGRAEGGPERNRRGLHDEAQRYANQHPKAEQAWKRRTNIRKPGDKEGLKESDTTQAPTLSIGWQPGSQVIRCSMCNKPHRGDCNYQAQDRCEVCKGFHFGVCKERKYGQVKPPT